MSEKKLLTRDEFEDLRVESARAMCADRVLCRDALNVLTRADEHMWIHQTNWLGEPILNLPQDMFAIQEILFRTRPKFVIELGVAWGGSLLFYSTLMEILGGERVIGVDIYMPEDLKERLSSHGSISGRLELMNLSSVEEDTVGRIRTIVGDCREVMVLLDSYHTHDHVLRELNLYSPLVGRGYYLVCGDTIVEDIPEQKHRPRPWGPGNNPKTAVDQFLRENEDFEVDRELENKLLLSCNQGGYLRRVR